MAKAPATRSRAHEIEALLDRNITALIERRRREDHRKTRGERVAQVVSDFAGSMRFVYWHLAILFLWVSVNAGWLGFIAPFDPTFVILATVASVEGIFLGAFILITQNRMEAIADQRADLDLHVNLLTEHELTQLLALVAKIAEKLQVEGAAIASVDDLRRDVHPEHVLERMDKADEAAAAKAAGEGQEGPPGADQSSA